MLTQRPKDLYAGLIFIAAGGALFLAAQQYEVGSANRMGPGYLPALMGVVLVFLGGCSLFTAFRSHTPDPIEHTAFEPFVLVVASVVAFAVLIDWAGFFVALAALIFLSCLRRVRSNPLEVLAIYMCLAAFCTGVFRYALEMPLPLVWW
jgi:drug/metabolite transporter (DMT)-like permease